MKKLITIGIAEDHPLVVEGLKASIMPDKNLSILFSVNNGTELLEMLKSSRPDILLLDIEMPGLKAPQILEVVNVKYPKIAVIIISIHFDRKHIIECFKLGVKAFLKKADDKEKVISAIYSVYEKGIYSDDEVTKVLAEEVKASATQSSQPISFTKTELDVVRLISKGLTRAKAAEILKCSTRTVGFHMDNVMEKTGKHNKIELVSYLIENKIINTN